METEGGDLQVPAAVAALQGAELEQPSGAGGG